MRFHRVSYFFAKNKILELTRNFSPLKSVTRGTSLSDSETDSDVLFESRSKSNGILRSNGSLKNGQSKYSVTRLGRRIKT